MRFQSAALIYHNIKQNKVSVLYKIAPKLIDQFYCVTKIMAPPKKKVKTEDEKNDSTSESVKCEFLSIIENDRKNTADNILNFKFNKTRVRILNEQSDVKENSNGIIYWMFRDQRVQDNWAFLFAQKLAMKNRVPLHVCFCLLPKFLDANTRHYKFLGKSNFVFNSNVISLFTSVFADKKNSTE